VKGLAELHGGRLELDTREGQGTTATVVLDRKRLAARSNADAQNHGENSRLSKEDAA